MASYDGTSTAPGEEDRAALPSGSAPRQSSLVPAGPASGPVSGPYSLSRGVLAALGASSAGLVAVAVALAVLGVLANFSMPGFTGVNAVVTGITLLIPGIVGFVVILTSREAKVGRGILLLLVITCHASSAFAFQCVVIAGQILAARQTCLAANLAQDGAVTMETPRPVAGCNTTSLGSSLTSGILALSIVGLVMGVVCSFFVYLGAPRLLCCLCDVTLPHPHRPKDPVATDTASGP